VLQLRAELLVGVFVGLGVEHVDLEIAVGLQVAGQREDAQRWIVAAVLFDDGRVLAYQLAEARWVDQQDAVALLRSAAQLGRGRRGVEHGQ
jgi:hypothetical protein